MWAVSELAFKIAQQAQGCGESTWVAGATLALRMVLEREIPAGSARHLWIVQSDAASSVRALRDAGPYDWAADEPAGGAA
jgi:hypothetical protein